jgi:phosphate starvation-inducible PhoH-like protein
LKEKEIKITTVDPVELFGVNESHLKLLRECFPSLTLVARGEVLKIIGKASDIKIFESKFKLIVAYLLKFKELTTNNIERILESDNDTASRNNESSDEVLVFGNNGLVIKPKTANQRKLVDSCKKNDMVFAIGPAGTGKTYIAVALAVKALKNREVRRIILTRPAVEAGENLGFLPGDLKEKLDPYLQPLYDGLRDMIPADKLRSYIEEGIIQIAPLAFMRGRTLDNAFVILDEAQNATQSQFKMFLTRMGKSAKFIVNGDVSQVDLPKNQPSGLIQATKILEKISGIGFIYFDSKDVVRHNLVKKIIEAYDTSKIV